MQLNRVAAIAGALLAGGLAYSPGPRGGLDMVPAYFGGALSSGAHFGHWDTPTMGRAAFVSVAAQAAGSGAGSVTFTVAVDGVGAVCSASVPCTADSTLFHQAPCAGQDIAAGARVHVQWAHTCLTPPTGHVVFGFEWAR